MFSGSEQSFNTEQFLRISAWHRGVDTWDGSSRSARSSTTRWPGHLDISTSGKDSIWNRYEKPWQILWKILWKTLKDILTLKGFCWEWMSLSCLSPIFSYFFRQSFPIFTIFICGEVLVAHTFAVWRCSEASRHWGLLYVSQSDVTAWLRTRVTRVTRVTSPWSGSVWTPQAVDGVVPWMRAGRIVDFYAPLQHDMRLTGYSDIVYILIYYIYI